MLSLFFNVLNPFYHTHSLSRSLAVSLFSSKHFQFSKLLLSLSRYITTFTPYTLVFNNKKQQTHIFFTHTPLQFKLSPSLLLLFSLSKFVFCPLPHACISATVYITLSISCSLCVSVCLFLFRKRIKNYIEDMFFFFAYLQDSDVLLPSTNIRHVYFILL